MNHYQITLLEIRPDGWSMQHSIAQPGFEPDELIGRLQEIIANLERYGEKDHDRLQNLAQLGDAP